MAAGQRLRCPAGRPPSNRVLDAFPAELTALPNWVLWRYEPPKKPDGKWQKVPYQTNGYKAYTNNRHTWSTFERACAVYELGGYDGIGLL